MNVNFLRTVHDVDFIIKEDEGIVVAKVAKEPGFMVGIPTGLVELFKNDNEDAYSVCTRLRKYKYGSCVGSMRGIAKCDAKDEFDVDTGKKIAFLKLRRKYNKYLAKIINAEIGVAHKKIEKFENTIEKISEISIRDTMNLRTYGTAAEEVYPN